MDSVLVLIAAPGSRAISAEVVELLRDLGGQAPHWLAEGEAAEVPDFERLPEFMVDIRKHPIDAATVSIHNRRKRLLIADMDSTMIQQECIDELGVMAGCRRLHQGHHAARHARRTGLRRCAYRAG